jgi:hypothetical protein
MIAARPTNPTPPRHSQGSENIQPPNRALMKSRPFLFLPFLVLILAATNSPAQLNLPWEKKPALPAATTPPQPADDGPPAQIASPDGSTSVRILQQAMPGTDGVTDFFTMEVLRGEKVVARVPTEGYLISAHWSPDRRLVAVNNRRGNSGDYLWVFSLPDGTCLKKADDDLGQRWLTMAMNGIAGKVRGATADSVYKSWLTATGWSASGELQLNARIRYSKAGTFDFLAPAVYQGGGWAVQAGTIQVVP